MDPSPGTPLQTPHRTPPALHHRGTAQETSVLSVKSYDYDTLPSQAPVRKMEHESITEIDLMLLLRAKRVTNLGRCRKEYTKKSSAVVDRGAITEHIRVTNTPKN